MSRFVFSGTVTASAWLVSRHELRRAMPRLLAEWAPGVQVMQFDDGVLWRLATARQVRCDAAPGLPLVARGAALASLELPTDFECTPGSVHRALAGVVETEPVIGAPVDVASWLSLGEVTVLSVAPLGEPTPPPVVASVVELPPRDVRAELGLAAPPEQREVLAALQRQLEQPPPRRPATAAVQPSGPSAMGRLVSSVMRGLRSLTQRLGRSAPRDGNASTALARPTSPSWLTRLDRWLEAQARRFDLDRKLSALIGQRQADYLAKLMSKFDGGDLLDALKHAIPLSSKSSTEPGGLLPSLFQGGPRDSLSISPTLGSGPGGRMAHDMFEQLRARYREAAKQLEASGRIDEAAFVLAELLQDSEGAVSLFERHGKLKRAAELAESRQLVAGQQVRLWFLAGDKRRAALIARRTGAFADAVWRLEKSQKTKEAQQLRLVWGDATAASGDYASAVSVVWSVPEGRELAKRWLELGIAQGGPSAAALLAKQLVLVPELREPIREHALRLLATDGVEERAERSAFAMSLADETAHAGSAAMPTVQSLARASVRSLIRDSAETGRRPPQFERLLTVSGDLALRHDVPLAAPLTLSLKSRSQLVELEWRPGDQGALPVYDAVLLPNGQLALALGEAGVRLLARDGRTVHQFDTPAHALVPSDAGETMVAVAAREEHHRLSRLNLRRRTAKVWGDAVLGEWANDSDGSLWFVGRDDSLEALDLHADGLRSLWRVKDAPVLGPMARSKAGLSVPIGSPTSSALWTYDLPTLTLRRKVDLPSPLIRVLATTVGQTLVETVRDGFGQVLMVSSVGRTPAVPDIDDETAAVLSDQWLGLLRGTDEAAMAQLRDLQQMQVRAQLFANHTRPFANDTHARPFRARLQHQVLVVHDFAGRVLVLDLETGAVLRDLRVR